MLEVGDKAPAIALRDQTGDKVKLSAYKGRRVLVFFYPKADTPREHVLHLDPALVDEVDVPGRLRDPQPPYPLGLSADRAVTEV